jgi:hypothetical protein
MDLILTAGIVWWVWLLLVQYAITTTCYGGAAWFMTYDKPTIVRVVLTAGVAVAWPLLLPHVILSVVRDSVRARA